LPLLGAAVWFATCRNRPVEIIGKVSPGDLAAIKSVARRESFRAILPDLSRASFKNLPAATVTFLQFKMHTIVKVSDNRVYVQFGDTPKPTYLMFLRKETNGWAMNRLDYF
jgi:hypothetical protein